MKTKLRGKKLNIMKPQTRYAKVPLEVLAHPILTPVDKLIIAYLYSQSDSGNYILAYTRIARELNISKKWVIERWKWLKQNDYILEDDQNYFVVLGMPEDEILKFKKGEGSLLKVKLEGEQNTPIDDITKVNKIHPIGEDTTPTIGEQNTPTKVNKLLLNGEVTIPNEYNKEEKKKSEYKIEQGGSGLGSVPVQSLASASQLAPSRHTPSMVVESGNTPKVDEEVFVGNTPTQDLSQSDNANKDTTKTLDKDKPLPIVPDVRFSEELKLYKTSKYFSQDNLSRVLDIYKYYGNKYPKAFMKIETFDKVLAYLIITQLGTIKFMSLNKCLKTYRGDIELTLVHVPRLYQDMKDNLTDAQDLLKKYELQP